MCLYKFYSENSEIYTVIDTVIDTVMVAMFFHIFLCDALALSASMLAWKVFYFIIYLINIYHIYLLFVVHT